jgi:hypothetical protein
VRKSNLCAFISKTYKRICVSFVSLFVHLHAAEKLEKTAGRVLTKIYHTAFEKRSVFLSQHDFSLVL